MVVSPPTTIINRIYNVYNVKYIGKVSNPIRYIKPVIFDVKYIEKPNLLITKYVEKENKIIIKYIEKATFKIELQCKK